MKRKDIKTLFLALPIITVLGACNKLKDFGDTNVNPGVTSQPTVAALLTGVESGIAGNAANTTAGLFCQYFSETQYPGAGLYQAASLQADFTGYYSGALMDLQNIITINASNNQNAVARILKAYIYWIVTDRWGDVPYSEALAGNGTPVYDTQESIYKGNIAELTAAVAQFDNSSIITGDLIYNGDADSWKKLGNSLRMLMALRLSKKYPGSSDYAATEFKNALNAAGGYITSNGENFTVTYPNANYNNPWYALYDGRKDVGESETMTDLMSSLGDARQNAFGSSTTGVPYGWNRTDIENWANSNTNWARVLRSDLRPKNGTVVIVNAAEVFLARAEAADRGWTTETAGTLYENGIKASFDQWGISAPSASYFTQPGVSLDETPGTGANLEKIATQRYIATYPDGMQGWAEWRRTGYPDLTPAPDASNPGGQIPRRYTYATIETTSNKANYEAAVSRLQGGDSQDSKVWWDQ